MIWCWIQAVLLMLAVLAAFLGIMGAVIGVLAGVIVVSEQAPKIIRNAGKYTLWTLAAIALLAFVGTCAIKAQQKVCAVGFKAAWSSVWK